MSYEDVLAPKITMGEAVAALGSAEPRRETALAIANAGESQQAVEAAFLADLAALLGLPISAATGYVVRASAIAGAAGVSASPRGAAIAQQS